MGWSKWDDNSELTVGDEAWDIMGDALVDITELYEKTWGRKPYLEEILEIVRFVIAPLAYKKWYTLNPKPILEVTWNDPELYKKLVGEKEGRMFLEDKHADLRLFTGESREIWWITGDDITAMTDCPGNYPQTAIHTMTFDVAVREMLKLTSEGWGVAHISEEFETLVEERK